MNSNLDRARNALHYLDPGCARDDWHRIGCAAIAAGLDVDEVVNWSSTADNFKGDRDVRAAFKTIKPEGGISGASLFYLARADGWTPPANDEDAGTMRHRSVRAPTRTAEPTKSPRPGMGVAEVWGRCEPATADHGYIIAKHGNATGLRVVPEGDPLRIAGQSMAGALVVPVLVDGVPASLQFIAAPEQAARWKAADRPGKLNLPDALVTGVFTVGDMVAGGTAYICEGIGQAWACWQATGCAAVVAFGWGRVRGVAADLRQRDASARLVLVPDAGMEDKAEAIARELGALFVKMPKGSPPNFDANDLAQRDGADVLVVLLSSANNPAAPPLPFTVVSFADLMTADPAAPAFVWEGLIPAGHVTLLAAHGGTGKSMIALMLAVSMALGLPLFGIPTRRGNAVFYSGEDGAAMLRYRLQLICRGMGVSVDDLSGRLFILDATDDDPTLFAEVTTAGRREGVTTGAYAGLREFIAANDVSLVVVDNASDAFDASEIDRARVRGFMRALARIARERDAAVLLLAHVDKGTSRGERDDSEGYSGSTAWHNSARSRLFMSRNKEGALLLKHQKCNVGKLRDPLRLVWLEGGIPQADESFGPVVQGIADRGQTKALLKLIAEFTSRDEFVSTATTSRSHAAKLLRDEPSYPKLKDGEVLALLRQSERVGQIERIAYKGADRKPRERWDVTASGAEFAGIPSNAATAATSPLLEVTAPSAEPVKPAATAATSLPGGVGEKSAQIGHRTTTFDGQGLAAGTAADAATSEDAEEVA
jgi:putative DNA primase/helicase